MTMKRRKLRLLVYLWDNHVSVFMDDGEVAESTGQIRNVVQLKGVKPDSLPSLVFAQVAEELRRQGR